jgi:hypothetical protein
MALQRADRLYVIYHPVVFALRAGRQVTITYLPNGG